MNDFMNFKAILNKGILIAFVILSSHSYAENCEEGNFFIDSLVENGTLISESLEKTNQTFQLFCFRASSFTHDFRNWRKRRICKSR